MQKCVKLEPNRNEPVNVNNPNRTETPWSGFLPILQIRRFANIHI